MSLITRQNRFTAHLAKERLISLLPYSTGSVTLRDHLKANPSNHPLDGDSGRKRIPHTEDDLLQRKTIVANRQIDVD